jgi:hypothetical protein
MLEALPLECELLPLWLMIKSISESGFVFLSLPSRQLTSSSLSVSLSLSLYLSLSLSPPLSLSLSHTLTHTRSGQQSGEMFFVLSMGESRLVFQYNLLDIRSLRSRKGEGEEEGGHP